MVPWLTYVQSWVVIVTTEIELGMNSAVGPISMFNDFLVRRFWRVICLQYEVELHKNSAIDRGTYHYITMKFCAP